MVISGANAGRQNGVLRTPTICWALRPARAPARPASPLVRAADTATRIFGAKLSTFTPRRQHFPEIGWASRPRRHMDEVGTGTDPEEAPRWSLGRGHVEACGAHVLAKTHYSAIKMYAANATAGIKRRSRCEKPLHRLTSVVGAQEPNHRIAAAWVSAGSVEPPPGTSALPRGRRAIFAADQT